jgi:hypothetical protein
VLTKQVHVPENNTLLRGLQFLAPEAICSATDASSIVILKRELEGNLARAWLKGTCCFPVVTTLHANSRFLDFVGSLTLRTILFR